MTFTDPQLPASAPSDDDAPAKPRPRQRSPRGAAAPAPIQTRLAPNCAWPTATDALPARRGKRR